MTDIRQDLEKMADGLAALREGGLLRGDRRRRPRVPQGPGPPPGARRCRRPGEQGGRSGGKAPDSFAGAREQMAKRAKDFDATVAQVIKVLDSTLEPVIADGFPEPVQAAVQQAREARDELRARCSAQLLDLGRLTRPVGSGPVDPRPRLSSG